MSDSISKLLTPKVEVAEQEQEKSTRSKCMIKAKDLSIIIHQHFVSLCQCSLDNPHYVNITLAKDFLVEVAKHTVRLNPSVVTDACHLAKTSVKELQAHRLHY